MSRALVGGCLAVGRAFIPVVLTTFGGIGPADARDYLDGLFTQAHAQERAAGGSGAVTARRRTLFYQSIQALLLRVTSDMVVHIATIPRG